MGLLKGVGIALDVKFTRLSITMTWNVHVNSFKA